MKDKTQIRLIHLAVLLVMMILSTGLGACASGASDLAGQETLAAEQTSLQPLSSETAGDSSLLSVSTKAPTATLAAKTATASASPTSSPSPTSTSSATATLAPSPTILPSPTQTQPKPTQASAAVVKRGTGGILVYMISLNSGGNVGCGDSVVPVSTGLPTSKDSTADVATALKFLVNIKQKFYGGLYNPLSFSTLRVQEVEYDDASETLTVRFSGKYRPTGDRCDNTRVKAQIWSTAKQFGIKKTNFYMNGIPFGDMLSNN